MFVRILMRVNPDVEFPFAVFEIVPVEMLPRHDDSEYFFVLVQQVFYSEFLFFLSSSPLVYEWELLP
jgi:hypothetical protein